ncbi:MAG: magnesium/cobalt transporter CorA [Nanoarchaeota archaeon]
MIDIYYYHNGLKKGTAKNLNKLKNKQVWIDITNITKEDKDLIQKTFGLHPLTAEDVYHSNTRIKVEEFPEYLFCVFYGITRSNEFDMLELDFILGNKFLITNHDKEVGSYTELKKNKDYLETLFKRGIDFVFHKLLDDQIDHYFPVLEKVDDIIENLEEEATKHPRTELLTRILALKRKIVSIKRVTLPQREKISMLTKNEYKHISDKAIPYFRDIYDHAIKVSDTIDNYRDAVGNAFDAYMSSVSNSLNEVMKVLSIIATVALPLTVISGIYGTNFTNLPGSTHALGFWFMLGGMGAMIIFMVMFFKRRGWF